MSSSDSCTCESQCPGDDKCACIFVYKGDEGDEGECHCECVGGVDSRPPGMTYRPPSYSPRVLPASARVAINTKGIDLARLAAFLDQQCEADVLVPEGREREKVSLYIRDSTLVGVIEAAGLSIRDSGPSDIGSGY